jgi:hypothetical protein
LRALGSEPGRHCLEVSAGGGSIARWRQQRAGLGARYVSVGLVAVRARRTV